MNYTAGPAFLDPTASLISEFPSYLSMAARTNVANIPGTAHSFVDPLASVSTPSKSRLILGTPLADGIPASLPMATPAELSR